MILNPNNVDLMKSIIAVLVKKLGGGVDISQADLDAITGFVLMEGTNDNHDLCLKVVSKYTATQIYNLKPKKP